MARWTVPHDDRVFTRHGGWFRQRAARAFRGSYLRAAHKGARLTYRVVDARELRLVVLRAPGHGRAEVWFQGRLLKRVRLGSSSWRPRQLVRLGSWSEPRTGRLVVKTLSKRRVGIDGLAVRTE